MTLHLIFSADSSFVIFLVWEPETHSSMQKTGWMGAILAVQNSKYEVCVCVCVFAYVHLSECVGSENKYMNVAYNDYNEKSKSMKKFLSYIHGIPFPW